MQSMFKMIEPGMSKKLHDLGLFDQTILVWVYEGQGSGYQLMERVDLGDYPEDVLHFPAPHFEELVRMLWEFGMTAIVRIKQDKDGKEGTVEIIKTTAELEEDSEVKTIVYQYPKAPENALAGEIDILADCICNLIMDEILDKELFVAAYYSIYDEYRLNMIKGNIIR